MLKHFKRKLGSDQDRGSSPKSYIDVNADEDLGRDESDIET